MHVLRWLGIVAMTALLWACEGGGEAADGDSSTSDGGGDTTDSTTGTDDDTGDDDTGTDAGGSDEPLRGNQITASLGGTTFTLTQQMTPPVATEDGMTLSASAAGGELDKWVLVFPDQVGEYSCAENGEASVTYLDDGGLGPDTATASGEGACTLEVLSAGPIWQGRFSGAAYRDNVEVEMASGYFEYDPDFVPDGNGDGNLPDDFVGAAISISSPPNLAGDYLIAELESSNDGGVVTFRAQNLVEEPMFSVLIQNLPAGTGESVCGEGVALAFRNELTNVTFSGPPFGDSCSVDVTSFDAGSGLEGTFQGALKVVGGDETMEIVGEFRGAF